MITFGTTINLKKNEVLTQKPKQWREKVKT